MVFDKLYFNGLDGPAAQFAAFATFAVGFFARPIGGLIFGHYGDRIGRKQMLLLTLVIMGVGTALIGLLPTYDQIGVWAPIALVLLRVLQGIGVGGEYGGAVLLAVEYAPAERRGFYGSFAHIGVPGGLVLAAGAFSLAGMLPEEAFLAWGWRACFLVSIVLLAIGAYIRLSVMETPEFAKVQERKEISRLPLRDLLARAAAAAAARHGHALHRGLHLQPVLGLPARLRRHQPRAAAQLGARRDPRRGGARASCWCRSPVPVSDRVGRKPVYRVGAWLGLLFAFPAAFLVQTENRWAISLVFVVGLGVIYGTVYGRSRPSGPSCSTPATATPRSARSTRSPASSPPA